ncbi:MAG: PLP-dependent aspartate aminotransferase family protein [Pseudomonadota bacterium]
MTDSDPKAALATQCLHAGRHDHAAEHGLNTPIVNSTAFDYTRDDDVRYPRYLNTPNHRVVAACIAALESADDALVTASGLGAISAIFMALMKPGDHAILLDGLYGGTSDLCHGLLEPLGLHFSLWDGHPESLVALITPATRLALVESPTNPLLNVIDLERTAQCLRQHGVVSVIDNTFATPILQRPIALGFDLVMHSGTKYLGGHSDLLCGAVAGSSALIEPIRRQAIRLGSSLNGVDLALLERSLKTLHVRVERQSDNALALAQWLSAHAAIERVYYPGLAEHPAHEAAARQMSRFGGMLSFHLHADCAPDAFLQALRWMTPAVSLGGVETTLCQPLYTSHAKLDANERERLGITPQLMRMSVGIEAVDDLRWDLDQALGVALEPS